MQVSLILDEQVPELVSRMYPHFVRAAEYTYGRFEVEDILDFIAQPGHHLWIAFDGEEVKGITVTRFMQYPRVKCLDMVFCGGDDGMEWKDPMMKMLQHWGYDNQCSKIESSGRVGWSKIFKNDGYKMLWQVYELPVASSGLGA